MARTIKGLAKTPSLFAYLTSSMFYRDALNGMYVFGGLYASGVLGWSVVDVGVFGILAIVAGALFAWLGGMADAWFGPKPVITFCILVLTCVAIGVAIGLVLAVVIGRIMAGSLFGVSALDPATFVVAPLFLSAVALAASLVPARRAVAVDPVRALQTE